MKLKKLLMCGFKSFVDRTELEFDEGISCIVGPNGCGKSNVVDAIKWVLGEQSAKSLRGSEMTDLIFNGSTARKAAGSAEVTLVFDNVDGRLQDGLGGNELNGVVSVTRRIYRSGQSEYLINKTPARLRDIREMFMDTGIGKDAYSVIEQGKVEWFLQANQDDRRAVFDEAAGISKYKARKKEALRKIERVEQNLLRINDVLGEVEKRLRSIKYQAGKARSYQTHSQQLRELRLLYFLAQYHDLSGRRSKLQGQLDLGGDSLASIQTKIDQLETARSAAETEAVDLERAARELQGHVASVDAKITASRQRAEMFTQKVAELGERLVAASSRCEELEAKIGACKQETDLRAGELQSVLAGTAGMDRQCRAAREEQNAGQTAVTHLQARLADEKDGTIDLLRRTAQLHNEIQTSRVHRDNLHGQKQRLVSRGEQIDQTLRELLTERSRVEAKGRDVKEVIEATEAKLNQARQIGDKLGQDEQAMRAELSAARERRSAVHSREDALREMQERLEGVAAGVRKVLEAVRQGRLHSIRGMLGDFLQTDVEHAPVVEAALAGADQRLVADGFQRLWAQRSELAEVLGQGGTVEIICLDRVRDVAGDLATTSPRVVARVIDYVRFEPSLAPAVQKLLGTTMVVENLADADAAADEAPPGMRFVTLTGEVLEADGRVRFGAANQAAGVILRRSELVSLQDQQSQLDRHITQLEERYCSIREEIKHLEELRQSLRTAVYEANTERIECDSRAAQLNEQIESLQREQPLIAEDLSDLAEQIDATVRREHQAKVKAEEAQRLNVRHQEEEAHLEEQIAGAQQRQKELSDRLTELRVSMAAAEEKKLALRDVVAALKRQDEQMTRDLEVGRDEIRLNRRRREDAEAAIKAACAEVEGLDARQRELNVEVRELEETHQGLGNRLEDIRQECSRQREEHDRITEQVNGYRVVLGQADANVENLITRAHDDLGMDVVEAFTGYQHDEDRDWDEVKNQIEQLTEKIKRLGNVNLDAIDEQDELQRRQEFLAGQLKDVVQSRNQLNDLIRRINRQSQELFLRTFEAVRENFHELFRKLFGGGKADVILTDPQDVLESGIEIVARPPGKELCKLSLLSGGEKTMTALALLFSIFKVKPSPFCLLDEVDAALDEPNTERFGRLLSEFVSSSQFIIISHAKRTMSLASVLYGVTMQEKGVSKRISVRFEDAGKRMTEQLEPVGS
ncbi:MAG: chromosome segregation protein SMC [Phycisphaerae bacterium]|nr:chromosome segregation protein SMC [Phycisphaerae bacterium]